MDYKEIKKMAKFERCQAKDLIVLAPQNDPFYIGMDSQMQLAEWFKDLWDRFEYVSGLTMDEWDKFIADLQNLSRGIKQTWMLIDQPSARNMFSGFKVERINR